MKKIFTLAVVALTMLFATPAHAGADFGVKGGFNVSSFSVSSEVFDMNNRAGWFISPTMKFTLPLVGLGIDASALYDYRSAGVKSQSSEVTVKQQQIVLPVNLRYNIGLGDAASIFLFAGPQWGINIGDDNFKFSDAESYSLKKSNFSVNLGFGFTAMSHIQVSANYNVNCGKSSEVTTSKVGESFNGHNNVWQISLGYFF